MDNFEEMQACLAQATALAAEGEHNNAGLLLLQLRDLVETAARREYHRAELLEQCR